MIYRSFIMDLQIGGRNIFYDIVLPLAAVILM